MPIASLHPTTPAPAPTPMPSPERSQPHQVQQTRWARIYTFPRNTRARLRYVPLRPPRQGRTREEPTTHNLWSCRTSFVHMQIVRAKYAWEHTWDYFEIKYALPIIPGFGRSNLALLRLRECPLFVGEVVVVRRAGPQLNLVADVRLEDLRKVEVAVTSALREAMGLNGRYRGSVNVEYMMSWDALDNLQ